MIEAYEKTFDDELVARKITLSRETRSVCLAVLKHVLVELAQAPTPVMGTPTIKGVTLSPESVKRIEAYIHEQKDKPLKPNVIVPTPDFPCHSKPIAERCDYRGRGDFMGHTCMNSFEPFKADGTTQYETTWLDPKTGAPLDPQPFDKHDRYDPRRDM